MLDDSLMRLFATVFSALMVGACATPHTLVDTPVSHMSQDEILAPEATLPRDGFLSTGQPDSAVLDKAAEAGYVAVIDFRGIDEDRGMNEQSEVESRGKLLAEPNLSIAKVRAVTIRWRWAGAPA